MCVFECFHQFLLDLKCFFSSQRKANQHLCISVLLCLCVYLCVFINSYLLCNVSFPAKGRPADNIAVSYAKSSAFVFYSARQKHSDKWQCAQQRQFHRLRYEQTLSIAIKRCQMLSNAVFRCQTLSEDVKGCQRLPNTAT